MSWISFEHSYAQLPAAFYAKQLPEPVAAPELLLLNKPLCRYLGIDCTAAQGDEGLALFAGSEAAFGADKPDAPKPIACVYAGHQFGHFAPQLGDGRAILLGELKASDGARYDLQLKGAGPTPYSRRGDGRATLGAVLREYLVSESMCALGIPTTRALAAVASGEAVMRETVLPGAVLTRVASSHIRVGTFQYFASRGDIDNLTRLANYVIWRHYPQVPSELAPQSTPLMRPSAGSVSPEGSPCYLRLLMDVVEAQASLVAKWTQVGFIHGVMNTDNMSVAGETLDYGPCAFMDIYRPDTVYSAIDTQGRYAFSQQPQLAQWNLVRLAEALLPLIHPDQQQAVELATEVINGFVGRYKTQWLTGMCEKLGLRYREGDEQWVQKFCVLLQEGAVDYTLAFRHLSPALISDPAGVSEQVFVGLFKHPQKAVSFLHDWRYRVKEDVGTELAHLEQVAENMNRINPAVMPRNPWVESALEAAYGGDMAPYHDLLRVVTAPYQSPKNFPEWQNPPTTPAGYQTFCGT